MRAVWLKIIYNLEISFIWNKLDVLWKAQPTTMGEKMGSNLNKL